MIGGVQSARKRTEKYENYRCTKMYSALVGMGDCSSPFHSARETRYGCEVLNTTCSTREGLRFRNSEESFFPTCQVRVSIDFIRVAFSFLPSSLPRFLPPSLLPTSPPPSPRGHCRTSTASSRSQWALPGFNRELHLSGQGLCQRAQENVRIDAK